MHRTLSPSHGQAPLGATQNVGAPKTRRRPNIKGMLSTKSWPWLTNEGTGSRVASVIAEAVAGKESTPLRATSQSNERDMLQKDAERLIRQGLPIIVCDGKVPLGGKGWHQKTIAVHELPQLLSKAKSPAIGLRLGVESLIDIESDSPAEQEIFEELFAGCDQPVTPTYASPRGTHRFYRFDQRFRGTNRGVINFRGKAQNGVKLGIRIGADGKGAQSVIPPSLGRKWLNGLSIDDVQPAPLPDVVVNRILAACEPSVPPHIVSIRAQAKAFVRQAALAAMLCITRKKGESDSSRRLLAVCCRAIEYDLDDTTALEIVREYEKRQPFQRSWTDAEILTRLCDAEQKVERGGAVQEQPAIDAGIQDLSIVTPLAWAALEDANNPPFLFRYGGAAVRIDSSDDGEPSIQILDHWHVRHHVARVAHWFKKVRVGEGYVDRPAAPPRDVVNDMLATPSQPLPTLTGIVRAPIFSADGILQTKPGYHSGTKTFHVPAPDFALPELPPMRPTRAHIDTAKRLIFEDLLGDFPFVGDAERAHAVSLLLLPFVRDLIAGPTPLHLVEKPAPGTGATLLVDILALPATGRPVPAMTEARDEDEWRKRITAKLRSGPTFLLIDNLRRKLDSAAVSAALTTEKWEDRILGASEILHIPVRCAWVATGNNPSISTEIARRTVRIRLDARQDRPWLRTGFQQRNLRGWAMEIRGVFTWAALVLVRAWIAAGRPLGCATLGMFEQWSGVIGGILNVAEISGFLGNLTDLYAESDAEGENWRAFLAAWWTRHRDAQTTVSQLWEIATEIASLPLGDRGTQGQRVALGWMLANRRDRVYDLSTDGVPPRLMIVRGGTCHGVRHWRLRAGPRP